jgi:hypothetical protein
MMDAESRATTHILEAIIVDLSKVLEDETFLSHTVATLKAITASDNPVHEFGEENQGELIALILALVYAVGLVILFLSAVPLSL